jgi:hypothetical protein
MSTIMIKIQIVGGGIVGLKSVARILNVLAIGFNLLLV